MQPGEHRFVARRASDLDGIMFFAAILGAKDMHPPGTGGRHRQTRRGDRVQRARFPQQRFDPAAGQGGQAVARGKAGTVRQRGENGGGQQVSGFRQGNCQPVQVCGTVAQASQRSFHGRVEIVRRIGQRAHPAQGGVSRQFDPGEIAVIGPRLERFGAPGRQRECVQALQGAELCKPLFAQGFDRQGERRPAVLADQHNGHPHAQVGAGAGQKLGRAGHQAHLGMRILAELQRSIPKA